MNGVISKELLSKVLGFDIESAHISKNNEMIRYISIDKLGLKIPYEVDIYNIAHKCKEWGIEQHKGFLLIDSHISAPGRNGWAKIETWDSENNPIKEIFEAESEPEAIFKACQWILDNRPNSA